MIIGNGGSGKSTLAYQLGKALNLDVVHLDSIYWKRGWIPLTGSELRALLERLVAQESWIIDGHFGDTLKIRMQAADTIIFLDFPLALCLLRIIKRYRQSAGKIKAELGEGYPEILTLNFIGRTLLYPFRDRLKALREIHTYADRRTVIILRSPREARNFLQKVISACDSTLHVTSR